jgi:hypothetical protein
VQVFHAIDVRRGHGDFKGWSVDRKIEFLDELQHIINETLESRVAAFIRNDDYKYYLGLHWPPKTRWDSKYTIMFRACLAQSIDTIDHIAQQKEQRLRVILEDGHHNAEDARRNYKWVQNRLPDHHALAGLTFDNKKSCLPLAAAHHFAYTAWGEKVGQKPLGVAKSLTNLRRHTAEIWSGST